jgi:type II secretory pathway pseudopilin PulG
MTSSATRPFHLDLCRPENPVPGARGRAAKRRAAAGGSVAVRSPQPRHKGTDLRGGSSSKSTLNRFRGVGHSIGIPFSFVSEGHASWQHDHSHRLVIDHTAPRPSYDLVVTTLFGAGTGFELVFRTAAPHEISNQNIQTIVWVVEGRVMMREDWPWARGERRWATDRSPSQRKGWRRTRVGGGFTLVEILAVILIIVMVSAVALPTVLPALAQRSVSEAARELHAALVGARDSAMHDGQPAGIRLLPDPAFPIQRTLAGTIDPTTILAYNRWVPLASAPEYTDGACTPIPPAAVAVSTGWPYTISSGVVYSWIHGALSQLILVESPANPSTGAPNTPTSWFWNIRVGDKIQLNGGGPLYTVAGPMTIGPGQGNSEMFVNAGPPGPVSNQAVPTINGQAVEYLALVNGQDDNNNGWIDEEFDGVDNDGDGLIDDLTEWESESWQGAAASRVLVDIPYTIYRRPFPAPNSQAVYLPTGVVIDATTALLTQERSRLPVNSYTGQVDVVLNSDGTVLPTLVYSAPSSFGMASAFYHFWLADRGDLAAAPTAATQTTVPPLLPIAAPYGVGPGQYTGQTIQGAYGLVTLYARTGEVVANQSMPFDNPVAAANADRPFNVNVPFTASQVGAAGS